MSNNYNLRKNGPWRLISDVVKDDMPNNDHVVDMIDIFPSTLTRTDGIDESYFKIFKFKNSHNTGSYILSREHEVYEPDYGFILSTPLLDQVKCPSTITKEMFNFIKSAYLVGSENGCKVFKYKGPLCMKRVHSIALSSVTTGLKYRKTIKILSNVHIKLHGIKKVVPVIYMGFMDSSSDQNIQMNEMIRQFILFIHDLHNA